MLGGLESYEGICSELAGRCGAVVAAVDYALAPEGHHPFQIREVLTVLRWLRRAGRPIALVGDGVGAYLAVQAAVAAAASGVPLAALGLIYPVLGPPREPDPEDLRASSGGLRAQWELYVPHIPSPDDPSLWLPDLDLRGLPPAFVLSAQADPWPEQAAELAALVSTAGVAVEHASHPGAPHDFLLPRAPAPDVVCGLADLAGFLEGWLCVSPLVWSTEPVGQLSRGVALKGSDGRILPNPWR